MEDRCVVCGAVIPEGRQICPRCEAEVPRPKEKRKRTATDNEVFLYILIGLAGFFSFAVSLLINWP
ncbi:MAG: DUF2116 family Zn-ribbon domain-containing protein [Oscillospiraceae bacterium]|nr:DUF2116 family Zn-ribbon domain-containing protein [Oscillospiraceae bacterium]